MRCRIALNGVGIAVAALLLLPLQRSGAAQPSPPSGTLRFLALADSGSGDAQQRAVGQQMATVHRSRPVDLVLLAGDNIYPSGAMERFEVAFRRPYAELLAAGVPFHAVLGNHDIRSENGQRQLEEPLLGMSGRFYSLRRGPVAFFMLDTNVNADWQRQLSWLRTVLARSTAPWKVVVGHHPIYSSGLYGHDPALEARVAALFRRHGVQLYINGHDHHYERSHPIEGVTYLVVGGGGAPLRPVLPSGRTAHALSTHSFVELEAGPETLVLTAWDDQGRRFDQAVLQRQP